MAAEPSAAVSVEPLLRVNYHFHWQMSYRLAKPLHLPAGTELQAVAWFDNSRNIHTIRIRTPRCVGANKLTMK